MAMWKWLVFVPKSRSSMFRMPCAVIRTHYFTFLQLFSLCTVILMMLA